VTTGVDPLPVPRSAPRLRVGALLSTGGAVVLLISMFALRWYGIDALPSRPESAGAATATGVWHELSIVRWLLLLTIVAALGAALIRAVRRAPRSDAAAGRAVAALGAISTLALIDRVLIDPPAPAAIVDVKLGAYLGLLGAVAIALGGLEAAREAPRTPTGGSVLDRRRDSIASAARAR
jgi:hypothetical protein